MLLLKDALYIYIREALLFRPRNLRNSAVNGLLDDMMVDSQSDEAPCLNRSPNCYNRQPGSNYSRWSWLACVLQMN